MEMLPFIVTRYFMPGCPNLISDPDTTTRNTQQSKIFTRMCNYILCKMPNLTFAAHKRKYRVNPTRDFRGFSVYFALLHDICSLSDYGCMKLLKK